MPVTIGAITAGVQAIGGTAQLIAGARMAKKNKAPTYEIPAEVSQNLSDAQRMALEGMPAEQKQQYVQNLQRSTMFGLNAMNDRKAGLAGLSSLVQNQNDAYGNLLSMDAQARQQNQQLLMQQRENMAQYKDKQFDFNKVQPYLQKAQAAQALQGAGIQNILGGLQTGINAGAANQDQKNYQSYLDTLK